MVYTSICACVTFKRASLLASCGSVVIAAGLNMSETHNEGEDNARAEVQPTIPVPVDAHSQMSEKAIGPDGITTDDEKVTTEVQPIIPVTDDAHLKINSESSIGPSGVTEDVVVDAGAPEKLGASPKEEETTVEPTAKQQRKLRSFDPTDTVDIAIGESGIQAAQPITVPQFFQKTSDKLPDGRALCWKDKKEDSWQIVTYAEYKKLIYNVAKSFIKVMCTILS